MKFECELPDNYFKQVGLKVNEEKELLTNVSISFYYNKEEFDGKYRYIFTIKKEYMEEENGDKKI